MSDVVREVTIRIKTEFSKSEVTPPDMAPLVQAQNEVKESTEAATYALQGQGYALKEETDSRMDAQVAMAVEQTNREKAIAVILKEDEAVKHSTQTHGAHGHGMLELAKPMTMIINSAMHLAHSFAMLTAANKEDEEQMVRSLMKYEGWIMGVTGVLHLLHGLGHAYHTLSKMAAAAGSTAAATAQAAEAATAEAAAVAVAQLAAAEGGHAVAATVGAAATWAFVAPFALMAAAIGAAIYITYELADAFDVFGSRAAQAAEEAKMWASVMEHALETAKEFQILKTDRGASAHAEKQSIRKDTDEEYRPDARIKEDLERQIALRKQLADQEKMLAGEKDARAREETEHAESIHDVDTRGFFSKRWSDFKVGAKAVLFGGLTTKQDVEDDNREVQKAEDIDNTEVKLKSAKELHKTEEMIAATKKAQLENDKAIIAALKEQGEELKNNLKQHQDAVKSAEQEVKAAQSKVDARQSGLGKLKPWEFDRAKELSKKIKEGGVASLEDHERDEARRLGINKQELDEHEKTVGRERDKEIGGQDKMDEDSALAGAESQLGAMTQGSQGEQGPTREQEIQAQIDKNRADVKNAGQVAIDSVESLSKTLVDGIAALTKAISDLEERLKQMKHNAD